MASELFKFKFNRPQSDSGGLSRSRPSDAVMGDASFERLRKLIYDKSGIYYNESKKYLLEGRVSKRLSSLNINDFDEYIDIISSISGKNELVELFKVITINETYFFRAPQQFEAFENIIVPEIIKNKAGGFRPIFRIWSAASSTGEEAYTLAILILEKLKPLYPHVQFQVLASDISENVLQQARKGIYKEYSIRNVPPLYLKKYFRQNGSSYVISDEIKKMVKFMNINLYDQTMMSSVAGCDVVFCCNVLIYFDIPSKQVVVSNLFNSLNKGGYLLIGYSESLHGVSKAFRLVHLPKAMVYKKD